MILHEGAGDIGLNQRQSRKKMEMSFEKQLNLARLDSEYSTSMELEDKFRELEIGNRAHQDNFKTTMIGRAPK